MPAPFVDEAWRGITDLEPDERARRAAVTLCSGGVTRVVFCTLSCSAAAVYGVASGAHSALAGLTDIANVAVVAGTPLINGGTAVATIANNGTFALGPTVGGITATAPSEKARDTH
jgi:hypothetical protein